MKNLKLIPSGQVRENVDNAEAARLVTSGAAVEIPAGHDVLTKREPSITHRDPKLLK